MDAWGARRAGRENGYCGHTSNPVHRRTGEVITLVEMEVEILDAPDQLALGNLGRPLHAAAPHRTRLSLRYTHRSMLRGRNTGHAAGRDSGGAIEIRTIFGLSPRHAASPVKQKVAGHGEEARRLAGPVVPNEPRAAPHRCKAIDLDMAGRRKAREWKRRGSNTTEHLLSSSKAQFAPIDIAFHSEEEVRHLPIVAHDGAQTPTRIGRVHRYGEHGCEETSAERMGRIIRSKGH